MTGLEDSGVRAALTAYEAAVADAYPRVRDAWERLSYREVLDVHQRLGDAAERLCEAFFPTYEATSTKHARAWLTATLGSWDEPETREERVALAIDLWFAACWPAKAREEE